MSADGRCPTCRANDQPTKLRKNGVIQELVDAWGGMRASLLEALSAARRDASDGGGGDQAQTVRRGAKRGRVDDAAADDGRSSRRRLRSSRSNASYAEAPQEPVDEAPRIDADADGDYDPDQSPPPQAQTAAQNLVPCPCCGAHMKVDLVYSHLDHCTGRPPPAARPKPTPAAAAPDAPAPPPQYLPFISYSLINEKALRRKLADLGIPSTGAKPALQRRHEYYVNLYNANCDADAPRPARALLRDLDAWERSTASGSSWLVMRGDAAPQPGAEVMKKDFDGKRWADVHGGQFRDLVAQARARARGGDAVRQPDGREGALEKANAVAVDQGGVDAIPDSGDDEFGEAFIPDSEDEDAGEAFIAAP